MATKKETVQVKKPERFIYLGPNLLKAGLQKYQVFKGDKTDVVQTLKEKYSLIEQLFVPISEMNKAMQAIQTKGTPAFLAYQQITGGEE